MKHLAFAIAFVFGYWTQGACTIVQASSLLDVDWSVDSGTVVFLDVDDTLICYPSHLGNERWFVEQWQKGNLEEFHRLAALLAENVPTVAVEPGTPELIHQWQELGATVIVITSRALEHPAIEDWRGVTLHQIQSAGFDVTDAQLHFAASTPKGEAIAALIDAMPIPPTRVLFIDDRLSDVEGVEAALNHKIELLSVWYRACEPRQAAYDSRLAADELCILKHAQFLTGRSVVDEGEQSAKEP